MGNLVCFVILLLGSRPRTRTLGTAPGPRYKLCRRVAPSGPPAPRQSYSCTRLVRSVGFYGADRPAVLETNRKPLIPFGFDEIGFVW